MDTGNQPRGSDQHAACGQAGGARTPAAALSRGEAVFVGGPVTASARDIRLALIWPGAGRRAPAGSAAGR